jgi:predicted O-methyltransferase YrrM
LLAHVIAHAPAGDLEGVLAAADAYQSTAEFFMSVGVEKGEVREGRGAGRRFIPCGFYSWRFFVSAPTRPSIPSPSSLSSQVLAGALTNATIPVTAMLELGTYCGYGSLTMLRAAPPGATLTTVEYLPRNAAVARAMFVHAGVADRVDVRVGELGDHVASLGAAQGGPGPFDAVFIDHAKDAYVPDLQLLLDAGLLTPGAVVVADNIKVPGAPEYRAFASSHPHLDTVFVDSSLEWLGEVGATDVVAVSTFRPA